MSPETIAPTTAIGPVRLAVADPAGVRAFYEQALGLSASGDPDDDVVALGPVGGEPLVELVARADAPPRASRSSGLFHLAILLPTRADLARSLRRVAAARAPLHGASDHLVSEALYLADPEGNGIELYRDRPRQEWTRTEGGELRMATLPLDLDDLLAEPPERDGEDAPMPAAARMGHIHLQVGDLAAAEAFYSGLLGFEATVRGYPGALFLAAGGYHHHVGLNVWSSAGGPPNAPGSRGLAHFTIELPQAAEVERIAARLAQAGVATEDRNGGLLTADPFGNGILLRAR